MQKYLIKLRERKEVAEGTFAFSFEKPAGFQFIAGQFVNFTLLDLPDTDRSINTRTFSIASAPVETDMMVATRMRDTAFKRMWKTMPLGSVVQVAGPFGKFTLHQDATRPAVFLAGGIGITPFRSIIVQAQRESCRHRIFLFYSNYRPEDTPFLEELLALGKQDPQFTFIGTMTDMSKSRRTWPGETGFINQEMLARYIDDLALPIYYIAGPLTMVIAMQQLLDNAKVSQDSIRLEEFIGY